MRLYRVFDWDGRRRDAGFGGPFFVYRQKQGAGRHDAPERYGAWYLSVSPVAAIAETIQYLRGHALTDADLVRVGAVRKALATFELDDRQTLIDLDNPSELVRRSWRPSRVATFVRQTTQQMAASIFDEGAVGFRWWSTLEASWINVTLFSERAVNHCALFEPPRPLSVTVPELREAALALGMSLQ